MRLLRYGHNIIIFRKKRPLSKFNLKTLRYSRYKPPEGRSKAYSLVYRIKVK